MELVPGRGRRSIPLTQLSSGRSLGPCPKTMLPVTPPAVHRAGASIGIMVAAWTTMASGDKGVSTIGTGDVVALEPLGLEQGVVPCPRALGAVSRCPSALAPGCRMGEPSQSRGEGWGVDTRAVSVSDRRAALSSRPASQDDEQAFEDAHAWTRALRQGAHGVRC